jgi:uncharacterized protein
VRIVLDTNVLVSAMLSPFGPPARILSLVLTGDIVPCTDARILAEYDEVLHRPRFSLDPEGLSAVLGQLRRHSLSVAAPPLPARLPDEDDHAFVEVGLAGGAVCLVTGNGAHFPHDRCLGLPVVTPGELLEAWRRARATRAAPPIDPPPRRL